MKRENIQNEAETLVAFDVVEDSTDRLVLVARIARTQAWPTIAAQLIVLAGLVLAMCCVWSLRAPMPHDGLLFPTLSRVPPWLRIVAPYASAVLVVGFSLLVSSAWWKALWRCFPGSCREQRIEWIAPTTKGYREPDRGVLRLDGAEVAAERITGLALVNESVSRLRDRWTSYLVLDGESVPLHPPFTGDSGRIVHALTALAGRGGWEIDEGVKSLVVY